MRMSKAGREYLQMVDKELNAAGVKARSLEKNALGHFEMYFYHDGKVRRMTFSDTGDWRGRYNIRARIRRVLAGKEQQEVPHVE